MPLEAICPSRPIPDTTSRGQTLRVIARMEAWRDVLLREDESLARVPPLEGIDRLGEEEFGQGIKVIKQEAAHVRRSKKLKSRGPAPLPSPTTAPRHFRDPAPLPRPYAISAAPI